MPSDKTLIQCDFDGTITEADVSFAMLDAFAPADWRRHLTDYREGRINVGQFNSAAFALVKADRDALLRFVLGNARVRPGLSRLIDCCRRKGLEFTIVSNGLDFYIETILKQAGLDGIRVIAAKTAFTPESIEVRYIGPDGRQTWHAFKEAHLRNFRAQGYRIIYVGNGTSDIDSARLADYVFAREDLLAYCREAGLNHAPFDDLDDVVRGLERL